MAGRDDEAVDPNTITFTRAPGERCWRLKSWTGITPDATLAVIEPEDCAIVNWHGRNAVSDDLRDQCEPYYPAPRHPHDRLIDFHGVVCADKHGAARGPCKWRGCPHGAPFRDLRVWWKGEGPLPHELPEEALKP